MNYVTVEQTGPEPNRSHVPKMNPQLVMKSFNLGYKSVTFAENTDNYTNFNEAYMVKQLPKCGYEYMERRCPN